jgi:VWFA-related protein
VKPVRQQRLAAILTFGLLSAILSRSLAQQQSTSGTAPSQPAYTLRQGTRIVLTDVTVTDKSGNPVHGLPASAFHVFDNKKPQVVASFEEHAGLPAVKLVPTSHGVFTNDYLMHLPPVLNVIVIDIANLRIADQMWLNYQLDGFLNNLPPEQLLAIYLRAGSGCFRVQDFTTDRRLLLAGLHKAIPRIPPLGREYLSDIDTLHQISSYLSRLPGRKNVLWFSGGSTAFLRPDGAVFQDQAALREVYDELERERIAVYPIDARGLTVHDGREMTGQHGLMEDAAQATGGRALYNNNGLSQFASHLVETSGSFYTLTYSPLNFHFDDKWHKVRIKVDRSSYQLSYRQGYFADTQITNGQSAAQPGKTLPGSVDRIEDQLLTNPIIFEAAVLPTSDSRLASLQPDSVIVRDPQKKKAPVSLSVRYSLPIDGLTSQTVDGKKKFVFQLAALAINRDGNWTERNFQQLTVSYDQDSFRHRSTAPLVIDQQLSLAKDDEYLLLAVWDPSSGRLGTLQISLPDHSSRRESPGARQRLISK